MDDFRSWFTKLAGGALDPHGWQQELATAAELRNRVIRIPTGMGKTLGVFAAWSWHRLHRRDVEWPRRLVWCLPMRVLVEQTHAVICDALDRAGLRWTGEGDRAGKVGAHILMGGAAADSDWNLYPEESAVFIGTQDMLLSRAMNRGYGSAPARWPLEFGLLGHDALWVMDEVQLMDVGLATSGQLQAFHDQDRSKGLRPRCSWWMSATLQPGWLRSVDTAEIHDEWVRDPIVVSSAQRSLGLGAIKKAIAIDEIAAQDAAGFAQRILDEHQRLEDGEHGRITLVVCNTVERACETFDKLATLAPRSELELVHSRFRPAERAQWRTRFLDRSACRRGVDRIIVATQVVEAGVDISAGCVVTELAPWSSLVQRFGRCARYGGSGRVVIVDRGRDDKTALPYEPGQLDAALTATRRLEDVGTASLESFEEALSADERAALYPYEPAHLLLRREYDELFDTTPDLTGAQLDIGRYIRSGEDRDVQICWVECQRGPGGKPPAPPPPKFRPHRDALCSVPFLLARSWLCGDETKANRKPRLRAGMHAWVWDWIDGAWQPATRAAITPGKLICVSAESGGYSLPRGFDRGAAAVPPVPLPPLPAAAEAQLQADDHEDGEELSASAWKTLACHGGETAEMARTITSALGVSAEMRRLVIEAARWHDLGKAHPAFQGAIRHAARPRRPDLAKAPDDAWVRPPGTYRTADDRDSRPGFRHELASMLALFSVLERYQPDHPALLGPWAEALRLSGQRAALSTSSGNPTPREQAVLDCSALEFDLLAYLVVCHHGKVRVALHASPKDQDYRDVHDERGMPIRGVREGDELPSVSIDSTVAPLPPIALTLEPATLGLSARTGRSWRERTLGLVAHYGPATLAWLEAIIIAADRRASRLTTADPMLQDVIQ